MPARDGVSPQSLEPEALVVSALVDRAQRGGARGRKPGVARALVGECAPGAGGAAVVGGVSGAGAGGLSRGRHGSGRRGDTVILFLGLAVPVAEVSA